MKYFPAMVPILSTYCESGERQAKLDGKQIVSFWFPYITSLMLKSVEERMVKLADLLALNRKPPADNTPLGLWK